MRFRVQDAKVALGERGDPWWEPTEEGRRERIAAAVRALLRHRDGTTICPSDAAKVVGGEQWRDLMETVRHVAAGMASEQQISITQKGELAEADAKGPIRLGPGLQL
ncbi:DUF3253 domain-containing protein [Nesterenkonia pannonica]|uniref:DUF3253 domain-containing protein n=1 Tax=Nesterenkonia pannonica TaxID=1548602 RepID=UPI002164D0BA|nr:DUF3253 domain-containing protein [Nesterenkonia pannonica]